MPPEKKRVDAWIRRLEGGGGRVERRLEPLRRKGGSQGLVGGFCFGGTQGARIGDRLPQSESEDIDLLVCRPAEVIPAHK